MVAFALPVFAQPSTVRSNKNEFSIGYGFHAISGDDFDLDYSNPRDVDNIGAFFAAYTRRLNFVVGIGATYCYDPRIITYYKYSTALENYVRVCTLNESCHSIMGHAKFNFLNFKHVVLYEKIDAGICFWDYNLKEYHPENYEVRLPDSRCCFAWQVATGIEVGNKRWSAFAQAGIGMEGNFSIGIRYGLKDR